MLESERIDVLEDKMNISAIEEEKMYSTLATFSMVSTGETDGTGDCHSAEKSLGVQIRMDWVWNVIMFSPFSIKGQDIVQFDSDILCTVVLLL